MLYTVRREPDTARAEYIFQFSTCQTLGSRNDDARVCSIEFIYASASDNTRPDEKLLLPVVVGPMSRSSYLFLKLNEESKTREIVQESVRADI